ncbi:MAG: hypothetical protein V3T77_09490, partial [Planctomycetota bacterium]
RGILLAERGDSRGVGTALRLERLHADDILAQQVAAEIYRRSGFSRRYALARERMLSSEHRGARRHYELVRLWWPIDATVAMERWRKYREYDSRLEREWCREGEAIRNVRKSLSTEDWLVAGTILAGLARNYPWIQKEIRPLEVEILESRLRVAESSGQLEEALVCFEILQGLVPKRTQEWQTRLSVLRAFVIKQALQSDDSDALRSWCRENEHILADSVLDWRTQFAARFQEFGCRAFIDDNPDKSRRAFAEAQRLAPLARPDNLKEFLEVCMDRLHEDLLLGRTERVLKVVPILKDAFPEQSDTMQDKLVHLFHVVLAKRMGKIEFSDTLVRVHQIFSNKESSLVEVEPITPLGPPPPPPRVTIPQLEPRPEVLTVDLEPAELPTARAVEEITRYYPHAPGSRWVYRKGDGLREERVVKSIAPFEGRGWKIVIEVRGERVGAVTIYSYLLEGNLILGYPTAPPGDFALRAPLSQNSTWKWSKDVFYYQRKATLPAQSVTVYAGTYENCIVVEGTNSIQPRGGGSPTAAGSALPTPLAWE